MAYRWPNRGNFEKGAYAKRSDQERYIPLKPKAKIPEWEEWEWVNYGNQTRLLVSFFNEFDYPKESIKIFNGIVVHNLKKYVDTMFQLLRFHYKRNHDIFLEFFIILNQIKDQLVYEV